MILTQEEARHRIISAQGLNRIHTFGLGAKATLASIEHLSYVQIDTISVVERAHHHTLWSRVPNYSADVLNRLVKNRSVFEYWAHAASYLPMKDFRFSLPRKKRHADGEAHWFKMTSEHRKERKIILDRIKSEGPLRSKDFEKPVGHKGQWFNHSISKQTLEKLFMDGVLMISERQGFQKVYDLTENVLPNHVDTTFPSHEEFSEYLIRSCLRSQELATMKEISYLRRPEIKSQIKLALKNMILSGEVVEVQIEHNENQYFALSNQIKKTYKQTNSDQVQILSPFDSCVIQRARLNDIFDFNYQIECYVPAPKRKYGYFALPLLYKNNFVGVVDLKAHRAEKELEVISIFVQPSVKKDQNFKEALSSALSDFSEFNQCEQVTGVQKFLNL